MRNRLIQTLAFQKPTDSLPLIEWAAWWDKTIDRWRGEGLPEHLKTTFDIMEHFGLDMHKQFWISPYTATSPGPAFHGSGILPEMTPAAYRELRKHMLSPDAVKWCADEIKEWTKKQQANEVVIWLTLEGFFWYPRAILGIEPHLYAFYDEPELVHMINEDMADFQEKMIDDFLELCTPDFMTFAEDMSYNNGPMVSKPVFDEFIAPYYRRVLPRLKAHNIPVIVDTDGAIGELIPWFTELGVDGFLPLERQAGVDINAIRKEHPNLLIIGGFDKTVMHLGEARMREEFERILPVMKQGGYVPSVDHQTPPGVSFEDYTIYAKLLKEYCAKAVE